MSRWTPAHCCLVFLLGSSPATPVLGAVQGELGEEESTAVTTITLAVEPNIQISQVSDIDLEVTDRSRDIEMEEHVCVRGNTGSRYRVVAAGQDGDQAPFHLSSEGGERIPFELYFRGDLSRSDSDPLEPGEASPYYSMETNAQDCDGEDTAAFTVVFRAEHLRPADPGIYSGFLTLTVAAE